MNPSLPSSPSPGASSLRVLLTGASGYVGQHLLHALLTDTHHELSAGVRLHITATYGSLSTFADDCSKLQSSSSSSSFLELLNQTDFDLADSRSIETYFESRRHSQPLLPFDVVIHLAALSSPLECQKNPALATAMNTPSALVECLYREQQLYYQQTHLKHSLTFIFISTDQVYDGSKSYYDDNVDIPRPIHFYGQSKLNMEQLLLKQYQQSLTRDDSSSYYSFVPVILRSSLVLGPKTPVGYCRKQSFLQFIHDVVLSYQNQKEETSNSSKKYDFYTNEYRNVIHVGDVIRTISYFIQNHVQNPSHADSSLSCTSVDVDMLTSLPIYNMGGQDRVSRFDILLAVTQYFGLQQEEVYNFARATERIQVQGPIEPQEGGPVTTVQSPLDISMQIDKLQQVTGMSFMGIKDMVAHTFEP